IYPARERQVGVGAVEIAALNRIANDEVMGAPRMVRAGPPASWDKCPTEVGSGEYRDLVRDAEVDHRVVEGPNGLADLPQEVGLLPDDVALVGVGVEAAQRSEKYLASEAKLRRLADELGHLLELVTERSVRERPDQRVVGEQIARGERLRRDLPGALDERRHRGVAVRSERSQQCIAVIGLEQLERGIQSGGGWGQSERPGVLPGAQDGHARDRRDHRKLARPADALGPVRHEAAPTSLAGTAGIRGLPEILLVGVREQLVGPRQSRAVIGSRDGPDA